MTCQSQVRLIPYNQWIEVPLGGLPVDMAMAACKRKPPPPPKPPGLLTRAQVPTPPPPKRAKAKLTAKATPPEPWDPERVKDEPKSKKWWQKGPKGKKKKMRAEGRWVRLNQRNFVLMHECDFTKPALPASESPSYYFRMDARYHEFNRYFSFLFQMIIKICRV